MHEALEPLHQFVAATCCPIEGLRKNTRYMQHACYRDFLNSGKKKLSSSMFSERNVSRVMIYIKVVYINYIPM
jgi:hypothetical protein